jgi:hypothetical protein
MRHHGSLTAGKRRAERTVHHGATPGDTHPLAGPRVHFSHKTTRSDVIEGFRLLTARQGYKVCVIMVPCERREGEWDKATRKPYP